MRVTTLNLLLTCQSDLVLALRAQAVLLVLRLSPWRQLRQWDASPVAGIALAVLALSRLATRLGRVG